MSKNSRNKVTRADKIPHFTLESVLPLLSADTKMVPLTNMEGLFQFSDEYGGTAYLVDGGDYRKLASFNTFITEPMRQAKCTAPNCKCADTWEELLTGCGQDEHEGLIAPITLHADLCRNPKCTEPHVWVVAQCIECGKYFTAFQLRA